jgi:hypothetical protein
MGNLCSASRQKSKRPMDIAFIFLFYRGGTHRFFFDFVAIETYIQNSKKLPIGPSDFHTVVGYNEFRRATSAFCGTRRVTSWRLHFSANENEV